MKILITGASGQIGIATHRYALRKGYETVALGSGQLDITDTDALRRVISQVQPDFLINCAAYTGVDKAELDSDACHRVNAEAVREMALLCREFDTGLLHLSTDYVFSGGKKGQYSEGDDPHPIGVYGHSKLDGEAFIRDAWHKHIILRVSWVFGEDGHNFLTTILRQARQQQEIMVVADQHGCPTYSYDVAHTLIGIAEQLSCQTSEELWGTYHYSGTDVTTWHKFTRYILQQAAECTPLMAKDIRPVSSEEYGPLAQRPTNSVFSCQKILENFGIKQRPWKKGVQRALKAMYPESAGADES